MIVGMYIVLGLGNTGKEYSNTRHNIGWKVLDSLAQKHFAEFEKGPEKLHVEEVTQISVGPSQVLLVKPNTYMNLSGKTLVSLMSFYKIPLSYCIVVYDELDIPFGEIKVSLGGGAAGHNGAQSVIQSVGQNFMRLRVGIGRNSKIQYPQKAEHQIKADFVLDQWSEEESRRLPPTLSSAADALELCITKGFTLAANSINKKP